MKEVKLFGRQILSWGEPEADSKIGRNVRNALIPDKQEYRVDTLSLELLRKVALKEPLILKAIIKKNKDTFRNWFDIRMRYDESNLTPRLSNIITNFEEFSNLQNKLYVSGVCANIYGTGFIEIIYNEPKNKSISSPVDDNSRPVNIRVLNSEYIKERKYNEKNNLDKTLYWAYKEKTGEEILMHPDRIIDIAIDKLPFSDFGISKIDILSNILLSKMNADIAAGETLSWFSTGILDMKIENMDDEQEKAMLTLFNKHPHYYVHDDDYTLDIKNPTRIDPKPFYDYFYTNIAAVMEMPTNVLIGGAPGISGSEVGISDYYHDIENIQSIIFTPIIRKLYTELFKSYGYKWNYDIVWNPIFVDEMTEGKIMQVRSYSAVNAKNSGIISIPEAREILNNGVIDLDIEKIPEIKKPDVPVNPVNPIDQPNIEPQPAVKGPTVKNPEMKTTELVIRPLDEVSRKMIEETVRRERELGESVLKEQEQLFKKDEKGNKNKTTRRKSKVEQKQNQNKDG